jgi:hypothetical protein
MRLHTLSEAIPRTIALNEVAYAIVDRRCAGRRVDAQIFPTRTGTA